MAPIFVTNGLEENGVAVGGIVYGGHTLAFKVSKSGKYKNLEPNFEIGSKVSYSWLTSSIIFVFL